MNRIITILIVKSLMTLLVTISIGYADLQAQSELTGSIIYVKFLDAEVKQYISLSSTGSTSIEISADECSSLSQSGEFIASLDQVSHELKVYALNDGSTIGEHTWAADWESCQFRWDSQDRLNISTSSQETITLDVFSNEILPTQETNNFIALTTENRLPDYVLGENVVISPDGRLVLYQQCASENLSPSGDFCVREGQMVIYDVDTQEVVAVLGDTNATILGSDEMPSDPIAAFWSPSSRFLLYFTTGSDSDYPIRIFDVQSSQYVDTVSTSSVSIDPLSAGFRWTSDESKIGFWTNLVPLDPTSGERFVTIELQTGAINVVDQAFNLNGSNNWHWSPDGQEIALVTDTGELQSLDLDTGATAILDTEVYAIEGWRNTSD